MEAMSKSKPRAIRRRTVQVITVASLLALVAGFALATFPGAISVVPSGQNVGIYAPVNTVWGGGTVAVALVQVTTGTCGVGGSPYQPAASTTQTVYLIGGAVCTTGASEWVEQFTFPSVSYPHAGSDTLTFYVTGGATGSAMQVFTVTDTSGLGPYSSYVLQVDFDMGASTGNPATASGMSFTINGS